VSGNPTGEPIPIESEAALAQWIADGEKPRDAWRVGTEHEKIGLHSDDMRPVAYAGDRGIAAVLSAIARTDGWDEVREGGNVIALSKDGASITLEPGGQLELSGAPLRTIHQTCDEFHRHLDVVRRVSEPLEIVWLSLGLNPLYAVSDIPETPKARYEIMRRYLPTRGELAAQMMHLTATVQANFDFSSEADMVQKLRTALAVTPIVSAIFANSSLSEGKANGFVSRRLHIWRHTDPDRCGVLPFAFEAGFGYERYTEWALDVPMFFIVRNGRYIAANGMPFRAFLESGMDGETATLADWETHLTTLFPEVRLKRILEVRGADAVPPGLICALPALWKGILYDDAALAAAAELLPDTRPEAREAAIGAVARRGLAAELGGRSALELARELLGIASEGLRRIGHGGSVDPDERGYLDPIAEQLELGKSPGQVVLERWEGEWQRSVSSLIGYARY
jgi:glutamate--cysteine ligase